MTMNHFRPGTLNPFIQVDGVSDITRVILQGLYNDMNQIENNTSCFYWVKEVFGKGIAQTDIPG